MVIITCIFLCSVASMVFALALCRAASKPIPPPMPPGSLADLNPDLFE